MAEIEKNIQLEEVDLFDFAGINDRNIDLIRERFKSAITLRGENFYVKGSEEEVSQIEIIVKELRLLQKRQGRITEGDVNLIVELVTGAQDAALEKRTGIKLNELDDVILIEKNDFIKPKTNSEISKQIFELEVPKDFPRPGIILLEKKNK